MNSIKRVFVEKTNNANAKANGILTDLRDNLGITALTGLRIFNRYDIAIDDSAFEKALHTVLSEPPVDTVYFEAIPEDGPCFAVAYLPGQYDQRADSLVQCFQIVTQGTMPVVAVATLYLLNGALTSEDIARIKDYCINSVDSSEVSLDKPVSLTQNYKEPDAVKIMHGFTQLTDAALKDLKSTQDYAMSAQDLIYCRNYFRDQENRDPFVTEIKVIDTYWSDHCRHTTFLTKLNQIAIDDGYYKPAIEKALSTYHGCRNSLYQGKDKPVCLMDMAVIGMKALKNTGFLADLDESDEINACSIEVKVDVDGIDEDWLLLFKNETHNHPTEIEPFGGAATCLGGAIRDPLSGRAYVYQAMRVSGAADPRGPVSQTLPGKLPQRKIVTGAAQGYSSYGNQIGLATGHVSEIYHDSFVAKRLEIGAVIGAVPKANVRREKPAPGDKILLVGGRTGRDGIGGATGSSKQLTDVSIENCGAQVQKGNPPTERKLQRLFRNPQAAKLIKRCNDFGAGGVAVAIGELSESLTINLDAVPKKYEGLDGTELAISESQERMAVVIEKGHVDAFMALAEIENLESAVVGEITATGKLEMLWRDQLIVSIKRSFLDTNGAPQHANAQIAMPKKMDFFSTHSVSIDKDAGVLEAISRNLQDINICSQKGLVEQFDSTIGAGTVLMPFGGATQTTPENAMVAKICVTRGHTESVSMMAYGYQPVLSEWSPFHGGMYAVVESVAKIVASGGDYKRIRLSCQEYFERMSSDPYTWGKPSAALLGALEAQLALKIPSIGGKDSMSGSFNDLTVVPVLTSFAVCMAKAGDVVCGSFKEKNHSVYVYRPAVDEYGVPDFEQLGQCYDDILNAMQSGSIVSAYAIKNGGVAEAICKMAFGNHIGFTFTQGLLPDSLFVPSYGGIVFETTKKFDVAQMQHPACIKLYGSTQQHATLNWGGQQCQIADLLKEWQQPLEGIFHTKADAVQPMADIPLYEGIAVRNTTIAKPSVFLPVFPGTNCEDDTAKAFIKAGGNVVMQVFRNNTPDDLLSSISEMAKHIEKSNIVCISGGFSAGDEPDGSGKFIAAVFRNPLIKEALMTLLQNRDGLVLGICNGFQALIKLGLVPYGEIRDMTENSPTLTYNAIGRHVSQIVQTKIISTKSPFLWGTKPGTVFNMPVSHGEGRFICNPQTAKMLIDNAQVATVYADATGKPTADTPHNPNGSFYGIEGITSPDGRVLGKMGHSERIGKALYQNVPGLYDQQIFESGIRYYL